MIVELNGAKYFVEVKGKGKPIVMLHGFSGSSSSWQQQSELLSNTYQVIRIDFLGHGQSEKPADAERYNMHNTHQDILALLNRLKLETVTIVGYSMGGRVALSFAIEHPARVNLLILESTSPGLFTLSEREERIIRDNQLAEQIEQNGIAWFAQYWGNIPLFASLRRLPAQQQELLHEQRLSNSPFGLARSLRGLGTGRQPSYWDRLEQCSIPATLIVGEEDAKFIDIAKKMDTKLKNSNLHIVPEAGHNVHLQQQQRFDIIMKEALKYYLK